MKRAILAFAVAIGLATGAAIPASALGLTQATLTCDDGTTNTLVVDADTLLGLTQAVQAMIDYPAGLTCSLAQVPLLSFGPVALAANEAFVVGGGRYQLPCATPGLPDLTSTPGAPTPGAPASTEFYWINIAVNAHDKGGGTFVGTLNETIPENQCVPHGHFTSKPTCLTIVGANFAFETTLVTQTSGVTLNNFFSQVEVTPGNSTRFSFQDNGNPGHQAPGVDDLLNGIYVVGDVGCAVIDPPVPDPSVHLLNGNITVHP